MPNARRATANLTMAGHDITRYLIDISYTDNYDKTDDIAITLSDREGRFLDEWFPEIGDIITAEIEVFDWNSQMDDRTIDLGSFEVDNPRFSDTFSVGGVAVPITSSARSEKKNRAWTEINLSGIASDIAGTAGISLVYDTEVDPFYDQADQNDKSDLDFLEELCKSDGLCMKVTKGQLIVYEESKYEAKQSVKTITKGDDNIIDFPRFIRDAKDIYKACKIQYYCPITDETYTGYFEAPHAPEVGHTLKLIENYNSKSDDKNLDRKAKARLREENKYEWTCNITLKGDIIYFTGTNLNLKGWGKFDGKYHINTATHSINNGGGYTVALSLHRCLDGY